MEEAMFLTKFAKSVTVVHRRDTLRASKIMADRALAHQKINFVWNTGVEDVVGEDKVTGLRLKNLVTAPSLSSPSPASSWPSATIRALNWSRTSWT